MIKYFAAALLAIAAPAAVQASDTPVDDGTVVNIETIAAVAPVLCDQIATHISAGADPVALISASVEYFAETNANAIGIDELTEFFHGILVGCAAQ